MMDTTFDSMDAFSPLDFDFSIHLEEVFLEQLVGEVSLIPDLVLAVLLMDRFRRTRLISIIHQIQFIEFAFCYFSFETVTFPQVYPFCCAAY